MEISFEVFEAQFMSTLGGFIPVYAAKYEDEEGNMHDDAMTLELICPWRLEKGRKEFNILSITTEQRGKLMAYLESVAEHFKKELTRRLV
jgi:hypothetical protein